MKNLNDYSVQELNAKELENTKGGFAWMVFIAWAIIGYCVAEGGGFDA